MVVHAFSSHTLKDHLEWGAGQWEYQVLPPLLQTVIAVGRHRVRGHCG